MRAMAAASAGLARRVLISSSSPHPAFGHLLPASGEKELTRDPSPREAGRGCREAAGEGASSQPFFRCRVFFFRLEGFGHRLSFGVCEDQLDLLLHLFQFLIAETRQTNPLFKQLQRLVERQLFTLQALDDLFELLEGSFEFTRFRARHSCQARWTRRPWSWRRSYIRAVPSSVELRWDPRPGLPRSRGSAFACSACARTQWRSHAKARRAAKQH